MTGKGAENEVFSAGWGPQGGEHGEPPRLLGWALAGFLLLLIF